MSDKEQTSGKPNPGSDAAVEQGCTCPVMDNHRGDPELGRIRGFWVTADCPLHGTDQTTPAASIDEPDEGGPDNE